MQLPLTSLSLLAALTLSLTGCPSSSPCDDSFVDGNGQVVAELMGVETVLRPDAAPATPAQAA